MKGCFIQLDGSMSNSITIAEETLWKIIFDGYPDPLKLYVLYTDPSKYAMACMLTQFYEHKI